MILSFVGCVTTTPTTNCTTKHAYKNHIKARITYYHKYEDKYGSKVAMPSVKKAKEGTTVAARRKFLFGTNFFIPELKKFIFGDGNVKVQDRGIAVEKLKASHGKTEVIDVYIDAPNKRTAYQRISHITASASPYMDVYY